MLPSKVLLKLEYVGTRVNVPHIHCILSQRTRNNHFLEHSLKERLDGSDYGWGVEDSLRREGYPIEVESKVKSRISNLHIIAPIMLSCTRAIKRASVTSLRSISTVLNSSVNVYSNSYKVVFVCITES